jgi:predicted XRE-type DNA-binding protein
MNKQLKKKIKSCGYHQWEIAELLGISESHFCKLLRKELDDDLKQEIEKILKQTI